MADKLAALLSPLFISPPHLLTPSHPHSSPPYPLFLISPQVDKLREEGVGDMAVMRMRGTSPNMEAGVLLHNIQRIIQVGVVTGLTHDLWVWPGA